MFQHARLRLTAWYILIIMLVSVMFSVAFYNLSTREINRIIRLEEMRAQNLNEDRPVPRGFVIREPSIKDLEETTTRIRMILIFINAGIFVFAGGAAYFLAGRTLKPIQEMVDEQNRFISDASHEMRTPLTSLRAEIEVALRDKEMTLLQARKILESNLEEVKSLGGLSNSLLELSQTGKPQNMNFTFFPIGDSINQAIKKLNGSIAKKKINIEQNVENVNVRGIPDRITELFVILLDNAVKYSPPKSSINIVVKKIDRKVRIEIRDKGIGIKKEELPHVWDRFYRSDKSRTSISGFGLGLSIAKEIVEVHSGTINITSSSKGTTIMIEFSA